MSTAAILLAAGSSVRMGFNKLLIPLVGLTPLERSLRALCSCSDIDQILIAVSDQTRPEAEKLLSKYLLPITIVSGGDTRQQSVYNCLKQCESTQIVVVHDAARCLVDPAVIAESIKSAAQFGSGVAMISSNDTVKLLSKEDYSTLPRENIWFTQTPQTFRYELIRKAYDKAEIDQYTGTDDASLVEHLGIKIKKVLGSKYNIKLTTQEDIPLMQAILSISEDKSMRIGYGEDTHRLVSGRKLILGGIEIDFELGALGHSDADVLAHAVMDAMLGAAALGDIGFHFPDSDPAYKDISSLVLLEHTRTLLYERGYTVSNIDATIIAQKPKLSPYIPKMREKMANSLKLDPAKVSVKATTTEGLGKEGRLEGITVRCVVMIVPASP